MFKLFIDVATGDYYVELTAGRTFYLELADWQGEGGIAYNRSEFVDEDNVLTLHFVSEYSKAQLMAM